jgi:hypothetical protein
MLGNPLVRFCEGRGGNWPLMLDTRLRAPRLLDRMGHEQEVTIMINGK